MSVRWLALVEKAKMKNFHQVPFFFLHQPHLLDVTTSTPLSIVWRTAAALFASASFSLRLAPAKLRLLLPFVRFSANRPPPPTAQHGLRRLHYQRSLIPVHTGGLASNSVGPLHLYPGPEHADLRAGPPEGPGQSTEGSSRHAEGSGWKECHPSKVCIGIGMLAEGAGGPSHSRNGHGHGRHYPGPQAQSGSG